MTAQYLQRVRDRHPLVHCITNYVTVNDCANILLAAGASPTMADTPEEMEEIVTLANGLSVNIGTLSEQTVRSMDLAVRTAKKLNRPAVLDPVGAGASNLRTRTARKLMETGAFSLVRGNISEMRALAGVSFTSRGVDASTDDSVTEANLDENIRLFAEYASVHHCVAEVSGALCIVTDGKRTFVIRNGHHMMARVTGTGCMLTVLSAAFLAASPDQPLEAAAAALCMMGVSGECAFRRMLPGEGNASFRTRLIDAVYNMDSDTLERMSRYEIR